MQGPRRSRNRIVGVLLLALTATGCAPREPRRDETTSRLPGSWRAALGSPGGELPFLLIVSRDLSTPSGLRAVAVNGSERAPLSSVSVEGADVILDFDFYDSTITAQLDPASQEIVGHWRKVVPEGFSTLPFRARSIADGSSQRFDAPAGSQPTHEPRDFSGDWVVQFTDESGPSAARGEFHQDGNRLTGTFLTSTGDYRFLEGNVFGNQLRLSTFDGGHAFLFHATLTEDDTLAGDFWSRDTYHAIWTAQRAETGTSTLPDAWSLAGLTNSESRFEFEFPDLEGTMVSLSQDRFDGKVVVVNIFGSWCPNCNDEAPLLAAWDRRFRDRGLEIVGLAYEFTGNRDRDARQVRRYAERHGIEFPLLLAGVADKTKAAESLSDLTSVIAYPTSVFIGRDAKVRRIHSGFSGPGTGAHYRELVAEFESLLDELLAEGGVEPPAGIG